MIRYRYSIHICGSRAVRWASALLLMFPLSGLADHPMLDYILDSGDAGMLSRWAARYEHGISVPQNIDRAIQLYCKAAQSGDRGAQYGLGTIYALGRAGKKNEVLATTWLRLAAAQNHVGAQKLLTKLGDYGIRIERKAECVSSEHLTAEALPKLPPFGVPKFRGSKHPNYSKVEGLVLKLAPQYGLNPDLVLAIVAVESNFNPRALSPKNARGLMQLIPPTAARFGVKDIWDPEQNLRGGMAYLRWLLGHFKGDLHLALAAYNAGEHAVHRYGGIPPYPETQNYVRRITESLNLEQTI